MSETTGRMRIVVMGVSGAGKSTVALALAARLGGVYLDADDLHDDAARAKMAAGVPLTDEDRAPWLGRVGLAFGTASETGPVVIACSALRRRYRDLIRAEATEPIFFAALELDEATLAKRVAARTDHFMPVSLLASQLETLEPLQPDEWGVTVSTRDSVPEVVARIVEALPDQGTIEST